MCGIDVFRVSKKTSRIGFKKSTWLGRSCLFFLLLSLFYILRIIMNYHWFYNHSTIFYYLSTSFLLINKNTCVFFAKKATIPIDRRRQTPPNRWFWTFRSHQIHDVMAYLLTPNAPNVWIYLHDLGEKMATWTRGKWLGTYSLHRASGHYLLHPKRLTWNPRIQSPWKRFYVNLLGVYPPSLKLT